MKFKLWAQRLARVSPLFSLLLNRIFFPNLHCGILVELPSNEDFKVANGIRIGALTRIYLGAQGRIALDDEVSIGRDVHLQTGSGALLIGRRTSIQDRCRIYGDVTVGQGCLFAPGIYVSSGEHVFDLAPHLPIQVQERLAEPASKAVLIGDDCWLGANVVIMPGVEIGKGCIVGAGSVITRNVLPYSVVAGAPARMLRKRLEFLPPSEIDARRDKDWPYFYSGFDAAQLAEPDRGGLTANGDFSVALSYPSASRLRIQVLPGQKGMEIKFFDQSVTLSGHEEELFFDVPAEHSAANRFAIRSSGTIKIVRVNLA